MAQSTKDSNGGKTHKSKAKDTGGHSGKASAKGKAGDKSPTGSPRHGEKKSTPH